MKCLVLLFSFLFTTSAFALPDLEQQLSLTIKNYSGADFLKEISKKSNIQFVMNGKIKFSRKVSFYVKDESLKKILDGFALAQNVAWTAEGDNLVKISLK